MHEDLGLPFGTLKNMNMTGQVFKSYQYLVLCTRRATPGAASSAPATPASAASTLAAARPPLEHGLRRPRYQPEFS